MDTISPYLEKLPAALRVCVSRDWEGYREAAADAGIKPVSNHELLQVLLRVWACSDFIAQTCSQYPDLLEALLASGDLRRDYLEEEFVYRVHARLQEVRDEPDLMRTLRTLRRYEMVRIAWRDIAGWAGLDETMRDLSLLAEACIDAALYRLHEWQCRELGTPRDPAGRAQSLVVLGMGKLGARELNFSSDVDLIFAYPGEGRTRGRRTRISNEEYFQQLGQRLVQVLDIPTEDGFVFRVDTRLRPFGDSGPLVVGFSAMEDYYQLHGREWERYAMIKARVVAGDRRAGEELLRLLQPFIYRRYLDFGTFESLREMKRMISGHVERNHAKCNIKLGAGGIREVEFIVQAFQLIRGGREPALRGRALQTVLPRLTEYGHLPEYVSRQLMGAYEFLRNTEHRLQEISDRQTHTLPDDEVDRLRLVCGMDFDTWENFRTVLCTHMERVRGIFEQVFEAPQRAPADAGDDVSVIWAGMLDDREAAEILTQSGYEDPQEALRRLEQLRQGYSYRALTPQGRDRMDRLMPLLIAALGGTTQPTRNLQRVLELIETISLRSAYLALLVENPMALSQLVKLCSASPWIAGQLAGHPLLLDELLDPRTLYTPPDRSGLERDLQHRLEHVAEEDLEQQMEVLRQFRQAAMLRVAAADISGELPLMKVSDRLTDIAEVVLREVLSLNLRHLMARHGEPHCRIGRRRCVSGFIVVAYGKLGGIELGYGSDLDLVFLYAGPEDALSTGRKPLENAVFFARIGTRMIHMLTTFTPSGVLYEVDMRLRPSGASGLLVSPLAAFEEYQRSAAWTWEYQALVRARVVAGDPLVAREFERIRRQVLARPRTAEVLRSEVREMRQRMRNEFGRSERGVFDLKQDNGGITDIEFMVQYIVLLRAHDHPELLERTDNIRLLEGIARAGLMAAEDAALLADAYRSYRSEVHRLTLQGESSRVREDAFRESRQAVTRIWNSLIEPAGPVRAVNTRGRSKRRARK